MDLRHTRRERPFELAGANEETEAAVVGHITAHLGPVTSVYHEFLSDLVHIDVHVVAPTAERDFHTLVRMLTPPVLATEEFALLTTESGKEIAFHEVLPLHADELALKLAEGTGALIDRLIAAGVSPIIDPKRPSCV